MDSVRGDAVEDEISEVAFPPVGAGDLAGDTD